MEEFLLVAVLLVLGLGAYWTMVLMPRQRDFQKRQQFARSLSEGDEIVTYGGLIGKVLAIDAEQGVATVELADGVVVRLLTAAIMHPYNPQEIAENAQRGFGNSDERTGAK